MTESRARDERRNAVGLSVFMSGTFAAKLLVIMVLVKTWQSPIAVKMNIL